MPEYRNIRPQIQVNFNRRSGMPSIVLGQPFSDFAGTESNYGIFICIVIRYPVEDVYANGALFKVGTLTVECLLDDVTQECGVPVAPSKQVVLQQLLKLAQNRCRLVSGGCNWRSKISLQEFVLFGCSPKPARKVGYD